METKKKLDKKWVISITMCVLGVVALVAGVIMMILNFGQTAAMQDGEYLVSASEWVLEDESDGVVWKFTEIGKGTLTTNNHLNDYDFIWALKDDKLSIETKWLYELENEYEYELNQGDGGLVLKEGDEEHKFVAHFENQD